MPGRSLGSEFEGLNIKGFGQTLDILRQLPRIRRELLRLWDEAQTRLHALPVSDFVDRVDMAGILWREFYLRVLISLACAARSKSLA